MEPDYKNYNLLQKNSNNFYLSKLQYKKYRRTKYKFDATGIYWFLL
jgi:hypothetical protein